MSLPFAILTALLERESTGIELTRRFDRSFGYFWMATHQQIYRELDRLKKDGFVAASTPPGGSGRGQPKQFAITDAGVTALREWLADTDEPTAVRASIAVRLRAAAATGDVAAARAAIVHHLDVHERRLANYREIDRRDFSITDQDADIVRHLVLKAGMRTEQAWVDWCRDALLMIDKLETRPSGPTGSR